MKKGFLTGVFSIIRFQNLVIISLSLYLARYAIITPILDYTGYASSINNSNYSLLVVATLFIAAAGYVINDYFDTGIDTINKPGKNKTGILITRQGAIVLYVLLNLAGFSIIWHFGFLQGIRYPLLLFIFSAGLLYFYSSSYKKMFLVGNLVVSFLTALTIGLSVLFDHQALLSEPVKLLISAYALFAFMMTLIREIIKDCEDVEGDSVFGATTLAVVAGTKTAHVIASLLTAILLGSIVYIQVLQAQWQNLVAFLYTVVLIQLPLLVLMIRGLLSKTKKDENWNSRLAKLIMVTGIGSMLVFQLSSN
ncbi:MAG: geranylgeranylglycerol-phosphate geranylgeranyltransferase [Bacteroidota bacterium]|nr:geranylgeranylglycerol-phosphate geranylgeranyltransferase [Bacteroidota bacterium]